MAMTLGIDFCKYFANSFVAEAYKRKARLGTLFKLSTKKETTRSKITSCGFQTINYA
jgi:hypothetical protein